MSKLLIILLAVTLWASSMFIHLGQMQVSGHAVQIYVGSSYHWVLEIIREPTRTLTGPAVIMAFAVCLLVNIIHFLFCFTVAWLGVAVGRGILRRTRRSVSLPGEYREA